VGQTILGSITELNLKKIFPEDIVNPNSWIDYGIVKLTAGRVVVTLRQRARSFVVFVQPIGTAASRDYVVDKNHSDKFAIISSDGADVSQVMWLAVCS